jgi:hypothetical protein
MRAKDIITHLFDYYIMKKRNWTLDRLVAWVETVEPDDYRQAATVDPEELERLSRSTASLRRQAADEWRLREEPERAEDWQTRIAAFATKHGPEQRRRPGA